MTYPIFTPKTQISLARFDGESAKRLGMVDGYNPFPPGPIHDAWAAGWESIPRRRYAHARTPIRALGDSPPPRPCPDPNPRRVGYE